MPVLAIVIFLGTIGYGCSDEMPIAQAKVIASHFLTVSYIVSDTDPFYLEIVGRCAGVMEATKRPDYSR